MTDDSVLKPITDLGEMGIHCCLPSDWMCVLIVWVWGGLQKKELMDLDNSMVISEWGWVRWVGKSRRGCREDK